MDDQISNDEPQLDSNTIDTSRLANTCELCDDNTKTGSTTSTAQKFVDGTPNQAQECDMLQAERRCYLMELPTELRLRIIELFFRDELDETHCYEEPEFSAALWNDDGFYAGRHVKAALALAHTSQVMRAEVIPACKAIAKRIGVVSHAERDVVGLIRYPPNPALGWAPINNKIYFLSKCCAIMESTQDYLKRASENSLGRYTSQNTRA